jgi:hypothetical protein
VKEGEMKYNRKMKGRRRGGGRKGREKKEGVKIDKRKIAKK